MPPQAQDVTIPQPTAPASLDQDKPVTAGVYKAGQSYTGKDGKQYQAMIVDNYGQVVRGEPLQGAAKSSGGPTGANAQGGDMAEAARLLRTMPADKQGKFIKSLSPQDQQRMLNALQAKPGAVPAAAATSKPAHAPASTPTPATAMPTISATPPITSMAGIKERAYTTGEKALDLLPAVGGILGGIAGGAAGTGVEPGVGTALAGSVGATAGGAAGKIVQQAAKEKLFGDKPPTGWEEAKTVGWEGLKMGISEGVGRAVFGAAGYGLNKLRTAAGLSEEIAGQKIPLTVGQKFGKSGGLLQQVERYGKGTWVGQPLKDVQAAQEVATTNIMNQLARSSAGDEAAQLMTVGEKGNMYQQWAQAREATRAIAQPMYEKLADIPAHDDAWPVVENLMTDQTLKLNSSVKTALKEIKDIHEFGVSNTVGQLRKVNTELAEQIAKTTDRADRKVLWGAVDQIRDAIRRSLTPDQLALENQANVLWRRSFLMDEVAESVKGMQSTQDVQGQKKIVADAFNKLVTDLAEPSFGREGGKVVKYKSDLDSLYDDPKDRAAMKALASFMKSKYSTLAGSTGPAGQFARIAMITNAVWAAWAGVTGKPATMVKRGTPLVMFYALSSVLANPGGPVKLLAAIAGAAGPIAGPAGVGAYEVHKESQRREAGQQ